MPITKATPADVPALTRLVNSAYRGEDSKKGWTTEAHLLDGTRVDEEMLHDYLKNEAVTLLKYTNNEGNIIGSVYLEVKTPKLYLGMLSVSPTLQGSGVGKALLKEAEIFAKQSQCHSITITVISSRKELISWYERHGYSFTGETIPFHHDSRFGIPKQSLELVEMEKKV